MIPCNITTQISTAKLRTDLNRSSNNIVELIILNKKTEMAKIVSDLSIIKQKWQYQS